MLCREIITVVSEVHTKDINTLCGQNVELLNVMYTDPCYISVPIRKASRVLYGCNISV